MGKHKGGVASRESQSRSYSRVAIHRELEYLRTVGDLYRRRRNWRPRKQLAHMRDRLVERRRKLGEVER